MLSIWPPGLHNHREMVEDLIEQNVDLFVEKDTDLGKINRIKMSIHTGNHPLIKLRQYRTPFAICPIVDKAVNDMLAEQNCISTEITLELSCSGC